MRNIIITFGLFGLFAGCGETSPKSVDFGSEDSNKIVRLIEDIPDYSGNPTKLEQIVIKGGDVSYISTSSVEVQLVGKPKVDGASASCGLMIFAPGGSLLGEKSWTFEKVGSDWKLKNAPVK